MPYGIIFFGWGGVVSGAGHPRELGLGSAVGALVKMVSALDFLVVAFGHSAEDFSDDIALEAYSEGHSAKRIELSVFLSDPSCRF